MHRVWIIGLVWFTSMLLIVVGLNWWGTKVQLPPPLEAKDCMSPAPRDELPNARFIREGGRTTRYVNVFRQGDALTVDNVAQGRDLRAYDKLELVRPGPTHVVDEEADPIFPQARNFLWEHWSLRKKAYLILTASSIDATSTAHIFIEKDGIGRWRVYWRSVRRHGRIDDAPTAYGVKWVVPGEPDEPGRPLSEGQQ